MTALELKAEMAAYWRFKRNLTLVAIEAETQDVLVVDDQRRLLYTEVKVSISDLRADIWKPIHHDIRAILGLPKWVPAKLTLRQEYRLRRCTRDFRYAWRCPSDCLPARFYFAVPENLFERAMRVVQDTYPYAGLFTVRRSGSRLLGHLVWLRRDPQWIHKERVGLRRAFELVKAQSASLANAYSRLVRSERE
jgi:hypothetical protein